MCLIVLDSWLTSIKLDNSSATSNDEKLKAVSTPSEHAAPKEHSAPSEHAASKEHASVGKRVIAPTEPLYTAVKQIVDSSTGEVDIKFRASVCQRVNCQKPAMSPPVIVSIKDPVTHKTKTMISAFCPEHHPHVLN
jgi:hypothetical protein